MGDETTSSDLDAAVELHHRAGDTIMKGSHDGYAKLSRQDDVTLGNPFGPFARGYQDVLRTLQSAASHYREGEATGSERVSEHVTPELACFVEVEHYRAKVGGRDERIDRDLLESRIHDVFWQPSSEDVDTNRLGRSS